MRRGGIKFHCGDREIKTASCAISGNKNCKGERQRVCRRPSPADIMDVLMVPPGCHKEILDFENLKTETAPSDRDRPTSHVT